MRLRDFLKSIPFLPVAATAKVKPKTEFGKRVFPRKPDEFIGKIAIDTKCSNPLPMLIVREWDEYNDKYGDEYLTNPMRNKYWGEPVGTHARVLCCIQWYPPYLLDGLEFYEPS